MEICYKDKFGGGWKHGLEKTNGGRETINNNPEERRRACSAALASGMERRGRMGKKPRHRIGLGN